MVFADNFNRADAGTLGASWTQPGASSQWQIISQQAARVLSAPTCARWVANPGATGTVFSQLTYAATEVGTSAACGPTVAMPAMGTTVANTGEFYLFIVSGTATNILSIRAKDAAATTLTTLGTTVSFAVSMGDVLRLEYNGIDLVGYVNGVERIRRAASLRPITTGGVGVGFYASNFTTIRYDDWSGGDVVVNVGPGADTATATDSASTSATAGASDLRPLAVETANLAAAVAGADDVATSASAASLATSLSAPEVATAASTAGLAATLSGADVVAAADVASVAASNAVAGADTAHASDVATVTVQLAAGEAAHAGDVAQVAALIAGSENASAGDLAALAATASAVEFTGVLDVVDVLRLATESATDPERVTHVDPEPRVTAIARDVRATLIPYEDRAALVDVEVRRTLVPTETRVEEAL